MILVLHGKEKEARRDLMDAIFRLRYEHFVVRRKWSLPSRDGCDIDQYDTIDAAYLIALDEIGGHIQGYARLNPTPQSSLLADLFPHLIETGEAPRGPTLYEGTRFALCSDLRRQDIAKHVRSEICVAAAEWVLAQGGRQIQTVVDFSAFQTFVAMTMHTRPLGLPHDYGGGPRVQGGGRCIAFRWDLTPALLDDLRAHAGRDRSTASLATVH